MLIDERVIMLVGDTLKSKGREKDITTEVMAELVGVALDVWRYTDCVSNLEKMTMAILAVFDTYQALEDHQQFNKGK